MFNKEARSPVNSPIHLCLWPLQCNCLLFQSIQQTIFSCWLFGERRHSFEMRQPVICVKPYKFGGLFISHTNYAMPCILRYQLSQWKDAFRSNNLSCLSRQTRSPAGWILLLQLASQSSMWGNKGKQSHPVSKVYNVHTLSLLNQVRNIFPKVPLLQMQFSQNMSITDAWFCLA